MSNLASCWRVPSQINLVLRELRWSRFDDIQVPKASMAMLIAGQSRQHQRCGSAGRPEHHLHTVGRAEHESMPSIQVLPLVPATAECLDDCHEPICLFLH